MTNSYTQKYGGARKEHMKIRIVISVVCVVLSAVVFVLYMAFLPVQTPTPMFPEGSDFRLLSVEYAGPLDSPFRQVRIDFTDPLDNSDMADAGAIFEILRRYYSIRNFPIDNNRRLY